MLKLDVSRIDAVRTAERREDLYDHLQGAIELEHSTIPVYLTALFSIKRGSMPEVAQVLSSIAVEEMLHMAIACNVLNAIEGAPKINVPDFIPRYPGQLPMSINTNLRVHLAPLSLDRVKNEFMQIEEPETPLEFPLKGGLAEAAPTFATIGLFYAALIDRITELGDDIFTGDPSRQVVDEQWFPADELFAVHDVESATRALRLIVEQGEGTSKSPLDPEGDIAHYYRFEEILKGKRLIKDASVPQGFSFSGAAVPFDPNGIWNMVPDPTASGYRPGSRARLLSDQFNYTYTTLLNALHVTFNGTPAALNQAMGLMFELKVIADQLVATVDETTGKQATPTFEYSAQAAART